MVSSRSGFPAVRRALPASRSERASERASVAGGERLMDCWSRDVNTTHSHERESLFLFIYLFIYSASFSVLCCARGYFDADYNIATRFPATVVVEAAATAAAAMAAAVAVAVAAAMAAGWYADVG